MSVHGLVSISSLASRLDRLQRLRMGKIIESLIGAELALRGLLARERLGCRLVGAIRGQPQGAPQRHRIVVERRQGR